MADQNDDITKAQFGSLMSLLGVVNRNIDEGLLTGPWGSFKSSCILEVHTPQK